MVTCKLTSVARDAGTGAVTFRFGKNELVFTGVEAARSYVGQQLEPATVQAFAIALVLSRQPTLTNPTVFANRTLTVDLSSPSPVVLS